MRFGVLGPLEVTAPCGPVRISGSRRQALLATLLLQPNRQIAISGLVEAIWPEDAPDSAVPNVRTYVHELRGQLRRVGDVTQRLSSHPGSYRLRVEPVELDLLQFRSLVAKGGRALHDGDPGVATECLGEALAMWRGDALGHLELGSMISAKLTALEEERRAATTAWIDARLALGQYEQLIPDLRKLVAEDRLHERTWAQLIEALGVAGRIADALAAYQQFRRILLDEIGVEPGAELRRLHSALLNGEPLTSMPRNADRPDPIGAARGRVSSPTVTPCDLPALPPGFVGRAEARRVIVDVAGRLNATHDDRAHTTVVAISGPPGVGKTATAINAAYEIMHLFTDARLFLALDGVTPCPRPAADAIVQLLGAFGFAQSAIPQRKHHLEGLYRSAVAGRRMILVLDDAASAAQIRPLLPGAGHCLVLVTSRAPLTDLDVDCRITLDALDIEESVRLLANLIGPGRVGAEREAAVAIVKACESLPLALRIAGAKLWARPTMRLSAFARRLTEQSGRLDELVAGDLSVRARLEQCYRDLDPIAKAAFRRLGRDGSGPITARTVRGLFDLSEAAADRLIEQLVHRHLLTVDAETGPMPVYRMSPLLRAYAKELSEQARGEHHMPRTATA